MRLSFRQGVVSHQTGGFLYLNGSGNVDLHASNRPAVVTVAHGAVDYLWSEDASVDNAWVGPFVGSTYYWLYWDFNSLTFERTFGYTTLEPVYQPITPGYNIPAIVGVIPGTGGSPDAEGAFTIAGYFIMPAGREFEVRTSTGNDGFYTVVQSVYDSNLGRTTIYVEEAVVSLVADGNLFLEFDTFGYPLVQVGRCWFNTATNRMYEYTGSTWVERIRVFAGRLYNATFSPLGIYGPPNFTGTQVGIMNTTRRSGRVLFTDSTTPIKRDDGTFVTTEDQFFANASRVDALRLESNVARAEASMNLAAFQVVGWTAEGVISSADYNMVGRGDPGDPLPPDDETTVLGILCEPLLTGETGAVIIQGVVTNPDWNWLNVTRVGGPLWVSDNGTLVPQDPHFTDTLTYPVGRVPVARVLARDTIVFEQGLGGKGDRGSGGGGGISSFDVTNIGTGAGVHAQTVNQIAQLKSLVAGTNITITPSATEITISATNPITSLPYDMAFFFAGTPDVANGLLGSFPIARTVFIDSLATNHQAVAEVAPTAQTTFIVRVDATQVGTVTFGAGQTVGVVAFPADVTMTPGEVLKLVAPAVPDTTIADVSIIFSGCASLLSDCAPVGATTVPFDMAFFVAGSPDVASRLLGAFPVTRDVFVESTASSHVAVAEVGPAAETIYIVKKNATNVGTVTFAAAATTGTVAFSADVSLAPGDVFKLVAPAAPDTTIENMAVTFTSCAAAVTNCALA
jgi:hypothetical protein